MVKLIDSHCHLDDERFDQDREKVIEEIKREGITTVVSAGYSLESSKRAIELSKKYEFIYATCGISPNDIPQSDELLWKNVQEIEKIIRLENESEENFKILAIGEIGLDYYWEKDECRRGLQRELFIKQIQLANEFNLPIVIHTREAINDTLQILKENKVDRGGVFHCCPQNRELIKEALKLGFYISFAGPITFKNAKNADEIISIVPIDRLLIETDSPYLAPEPVRGTRNSPVNVKYIAEKVARVKGITYEDVCKFTAQNVEKLFF